MKYIFGEASQKKMLTIDVTLQFILKIALDYGLMDFAVISGKRSQEEQDCLYAEGKSKLKWPNSKHNAQGGNKSEAVDVAPYVNGKLSWDYNHCAFLAGIIMTSAKSLGMPLRWGGNWDGDGEPITDQSFQDLGHYEIIGIIEKNTNYRHSQK